LRILPVWWSKLRGEREAKLAPHGEECVTANQATDIGVKPAPALESKPILSWSMTKSSSRVWLNKGDGNGKG
jgi:hypothetical protein